MKKVLDRIDKILSFIEENLIFLLLLIMLASVFTGLVNRYVFQSPMRWAEELARYLLIWATFIGASHGVKKGVHITVDVLTVYLPEKANKAIRAISYLISMAFCITIIIIGIPFIMRLMDTNQLSPALQMPMYIAYAAVVVGCVLMLVRYIMVFFLDIIYNEKMAKKDLVD